MTGRLEAAYDVRVFTTGRTLKPVELEHAIEAVAGVATATATTACLECAQMGVHQVPGHVWPHYAERVRATAEEQHRLLVECQVFVENTVKRFPGGSGPYMLERLAAYKPPPPPASQEPQGAD